MYRFSCSFLKKKKDFTSNYNFKRMMWKCRRKTVKRPHQNGSQVFEVKFTQLKGVVGSGTHMTKERAIQGKSCKTMDIE